MKLRLTPRAGQELDRAIAYIEDRSHLGAANVSDAIEDTFALIKANPEAGRQQRQLGIRKIVIRRYPYLVYYRLDLARDEVVVLNVKHASRARRYGDA